MPAWESKSTKEGSGNFNPPMPNISEGEASPSASTGNVSPKVGFGHEWTPPAASAGNSASGGGAFPKGNNPDAGCFEGGYSHERVGSDTNVSK